MSTHAGASGRSRLRRTDGTRDHALPRMRLAGPAADGVAGSARRVMETYLARIFGGVGEPVNLPLNNQALSAVQELYKKFARRSRAPLALS